MAKPAMNFKHINEEKYLKNVLSMYSMKVTDPMLFFTNRLETFKNWPFKTGSCTSEHMAYAGYHVVEADCAKCVFCFKELDGWEVTDDPWEEHKSHKPDCAFIKLDKRDILTWSMDELVQLNQVILKNKVVHAMSQEKEEYSKIFEKLSKEVLEKLRTIKF